MRAPSRLALPGAVALLVSSVLACSLVAAPAAAQRHRVHARVRVRPARGRTVLVVRGPQRRGFTVEAGLGLGVTQIFPDTGSSDVRVGLAPLAASVGGYVSQRVALLFRASGTSYFHDHLDTLAALYAFNVEGWITPTFYLGGGGGLALFGDVFGSGRARDRLDAGFGGNFRLGLAFPIAEHHALGVGFELMVLLFGHEDVLTQAAFFEWHFFA